MPLNKIEVVNGGYGIKNPMLENTRVNPAFTAKELGEYIPTNISLIFFNITMMSTARRDLFHKVSFIISMCLYDERTHDSYVESDTQIG